MLTLSSEILEKAVVAAEKQQTVTRSIVSEYPRPRRKHIPEQVPHIIIEKGPEKNLAKLTEPMLDGM